MNAGSSVPGENDPLPKPAEDTYSMILRYEPVSNAEPSLSPKRSSFSTASASSDSKGVPIHRTLTDPILSGGGMDMESEEFRQRLTVFQKRLKERTELIRRLKSTKCVDTRADIFCCHVRRCTELIKRETKINSTESSQVNETWDPIEGEL
mmetsp:Transcript_7572/g.10293  ORF Transcript_7572/g.10293 Transcript_7572/m.10293 type:complete len:151 (-) Transcript_7572:374-826(-)|eukprot:CAMPEP_0185738686 /NCGR_PEP_ID=MMETSP1171-20130828/33603_1 /TAXON_ID=374046 /ORGANISM="Helicotheca tamensis, Strain CCMP826" /LENGTH=150 /DNA_ID=CAMNT_0028410009 /DNA_START=44 /DNA_END=496 /DNA_ORIENTATION=+